MKKIIIKTELICPFKKCRTSYGCDEKGNEVYHEMGIGCMNCKYVWNRASYVFERCPRPDENSEEYKEYEKSHTPVCVSDLDDIKGKQI